MANNKYLLIRFYENGQIKYDWYTSSSISKALKHWKSAEGLSKLISISPSGHVKIYGSRSLSPLGRGPNSEELKEQAARESYFSR